jgi:hypothetical protein
MTIVFTRANPNLSKKVDKLPAEHLGRFLPDEINQVLGVLPAAQRKSFERTMTSIIAQKSSQVNDEASLSNWLLFGTLHDTQGRSIKVEKLISMAKKIYVATSKADEDRPKKKKSSTAEKKGKNQSVDKLNEQIEEMLAFARTIDRELYFK